MPEILPGHFDGNGFVDGVALLKWQRGESPNRMSTSDQADWGVNYGAAASLSANSSEVPEPSAAIVLILGAVTVLTTRRTAVSKLK